MSILANPLQEYIYISSWMSILANVSILSNQTTLIIKWMSIRANVSILFNQITLIIKWMSIRANPSVQRYEGRGHHDNH
jgi:hypothetical protein